jgi:DNA-binding MarR family transcriptional regulator
MDTYGLTAKQFMAWRSFHKLRSQLLPYMTKKVYKNTGLSPAEYILLVSLLESQNGTLHSSEIAESLNWEKSRISHQVKRMEERGLVTRYTCESDARSCVVEITPSGRSYMKEALPIQFRDVKHCFADLLSPAQLDALIDISQIVSKHLVEEHTLNFQRRPLIGVKK